ncbi:Pheromone-regulated membrane protein [Colletotrichum higginsianum IMI 349063]|uniref:Pheromone-regulated membrane protein n=1 Tax=Colletotrichum higginsianum (strain IMI 349063) TaxID=759273 RepID=A0A1B7YT23_COLHI|nr:Pheromone-regulated membrane protein [Colletotrichum higginsianum IMI 349063]OBR15163.1 Pheromone-regulated membrane protein [Colletotrichum higginsianum IMI 349063]
MSGFPQDPGASSSNTSSSVSPQPAASQNPFNNSQQPGKLQTPPLLHPSSATPQARKEKKRVGFHGDGQTQAQVQPENRPPSIVIEDDYFAQAMSPEGPEVNPFDTPRRRDTDITPAGAPDAGELRRALTQVLNLENQDGSPSETPARPRPVLRRNTSYDDPQEREKADLAERTAGERQQRSGLEARQRANRLAVSIENYSSPPSRTNSVDMAYNPFSDDEDADHVTGLSSAVDGAQDRRKVRSRPRKNSHLDAENLVRSHTKRSKKGDRGPNDYFKYQPPPGVRSGTATPTLEQSYAHDYVPPPKQYQGGILSSLLKLYNENGSGGSSGRNTPGANTPGTATPNHSPPGSKPASAPPSAPPSAPGSPRPSRPNSGLFHYHKKQGSRSSVALAELLKSSSAMAGPASSVFSQGFTEKIKHEPPSRPKKRKSSVWGGSSPKSSKADDKIRITKHIAQILSRHKYLVKLCRALMLYGAPTHRLEEYMKMSARVLEIEGQFLYIPGCMIISFDDSATHTTEVKIVRSAHGVDLGKLRDVHDIYKQVVHDLISVDEATIMIENITSRKLKFGNWTRVPIYGLASVCVAPFAFQGRFIDLPIAFILGCILGWMQLILAPSNELYANVFEITAAIVTSFLARAFGSINNGELFCFSALAQSSIALILPGYMVLCSSLELQSHNLVAGSVRMVYAMIYTLFLGYGTTIGTALYGMIDKHAESRTSCTNPLNRNWYLLFVPGFTLCLCIINQAKWKQTPVMIIISLAGFLVNSYSSDFFVGNAQISNMLGALTVGLLANLYSRLGRHAHNYCLDFLDWWDLRIAPRFVTASRRRNERPRPEMYQMSGQTGAGAGSNGVHTPGETTPETAPTTPTTEAFSEKDMAEGVVPERKRTVGYGLAAAAMLPAIFVQVPSGLAAGGSLLAGVTSADQITNNNGTTSGDSSDLNNSAFAVLLSVIQVAIGITVGLFLSALMVYPLGKRRSGLLSF